MPNRHERFRQMAAVLDQYLPPLMEAMVDLEVDYHRLSKDGAVNLRDAFFASCEYLSSDDETQVSSVPVKEFLFGAVRSYRAEFFQERLSRIDEQLKVIHQYKLNGGMLDYDDIATIRETVERTMSIRDALGNEEIWGDEAPVLMFYSSATEETNNLVRQLEDLCLAIRFRPAKPT